MSMNLNLKVNGNHVDLFQTPTYISYLLMTNDKGEQMYEVKGKKAKGVLRRYIFWLRDQRQRLVNSCKNSEERENVSESYNSHITIVSNCEKEDLHFYIM